MLRNLAIILLLIFVACNSVPPVQTPVEDNLDELVDRNEDTALTVQEKYETENLKIEFENPIVFASTENIAIPIIYDETERDKMDYVRTYFNVAIITKNSENPQMAFPEPVNISEITTVENRIMGFADDYENYSLQDSENSPYASLIFMDVQEPYGKNSNRTRLFIYNLQSLALTEVSSKGYHVSSWRILNELGQLFLTIQKDSNQDGEIDDKDDSNISIYTIGQSQTQMEPIFDLERLKKMKLEVVKSKHQ